MLKNFYTLNKYGPEEKVHIRRSNKAKHVAIRITMSGVELILPLLASAETAHQFLLTKETWVRKKLKNSLKLSSAREDVDKNIIPIFGETYYVNYSETIKHTVKLTDNIIELQCPEPLKKIVLIMFLKKKLLKELTKMVTTISKKHNLHYTNVRIMENKTSWGSCNHKKILAFNWRIIFAPFEVLEYLVTHEMAHLKEMNHSKNFWSLVAKIYPEYLPAKLWLKKNGKILQKYLI